MKKKVIWGLRLSIYDDFAPLIWVYDEVDVWEALAEEASYLREMACLK